MIGRPDYYDRFQCIAGACSDSCCIGWEIDVDEEKKTYYKQVPGELGERLKTCIDWSEGHFILTGKEERCPFLNKDNLCELIIGLGEDVLCDICREHPRFYEWYEGYTEVGVGLCCESAARLILEKEEPAGFILGEISDCEEDGGWTKTLFSARNTAFSVLQDRNLSVWKRLSVFISYAAELQDAIEFENLSEAEETVQFYQNAENRILEYGDARKTESGYAGILKVCRKMEAIDETWTDRLVRLENMIRFQDKTEEIEKEMDQRFSYRDYEYEHLAVYFVYRYFMKCREDSDLYSKCSLAVFCVLLIRLMDMEKFAADGSFTKEDRVQNAKNVSKEIEYSENNLEILRIACWEHEEK